MITVPETFVRISRNLLERRGRNGLPRVRTRAAMEIAAPVRWRFMRRSAAFLLFCALAASTPGAMVLHVSAAQAQAPAAGRQTGTVKALGTGEMTVTTAAGDVTIKVPDGATVLVVAPGAKDLKSATPGSFADVTVGDRVIVSGTPGEAGAPLAASRVILMKQEAIAQTHAAEAAAWAQGGGGIVKSVDAANGRLVLSSGMRTVTVNTTPTTIVRRYSGDSVRFEDAQKSTLAAISAGDQVRVRGTRSADGSSIQADELVGGTFRHYSGLLTAVDQQAGTVTLKDLTTKKPVTVAVTANSDVHRLPADQAQRIAARLKGGAGPGAAHPGGAGPRGPQGAARPAGEHARPEGAGAPEHAAAAGGGAEPGAEPGAEQRTSRAGSDLSSMLPHLPVETLSGLKPGDAVMIVATSPSATAAKSTAVTLLVGVDAILSASPSGEAMTLSPWSLGGGEGEGGGGPQ